MRSWQRRPKKNVKHTSSWSFDGEPLRIESAAFQTLIKLFLHSFWRCRAGLDLHLLEELANTDRVASMLQNGASWDAAKSLTPEHLRVNILISIMCLPRRGVAGASSLTFVMLTVSLTRIDRTWRTVSNGGVYQRASCGWPALSHWMSRVSPQKCIVRARGCRDTWLGAGCYPQACKQWTDK